MRNPWQLALSIFDPKHYFVNQKCHLAEFQHSFHTKKVKTQKLISSHREINNKKREGRLRFFYSNLFEVMRPNLLTGVDSATSSVGPVLFIVACFVSTTVCISLEPAPKTQHADGAVSQGIICVPKNSFL